MTDKGLAANGQLLMDNSALNRCYSNDQESQKKGDASPPLTGEEMEAVIGLREMEAAHGLKITDEGLVDEEAKLTVTKSALDQLTKQSSLRPGAYLTAQNVEDMQTAKRDYEELGEEHDEVEKLIKDGQLAWTKSAGGTWRLKTRGNVALVLLAVIMIIAVVLWWNDNVRRTHAEPPECGQAGQGGHNCVGDMTAGHFTASSCAELGRAQCRRFPDCCCWQEPLTRCVRTGQ